MTKILVTNTEVVLVGVCRGWYWRDEEGYLPGLKTLDAFTGEIVHSSRYKSGCDFKGKNVLVVGGGNYGM